jgi:hypothetical protein
MGDVKIKFGADFVDLERAFGALIKKIQNDADKLKLTPSSAKAAPGKFGTESIREAAQTSRNLEQKVRQEKAGLDQINSQLAKKEAQISRITKLEKEGLDVANKRLRAERDLLGLQNTQQVMQARLSDAQKAHDRAKRPGGQGGNGIGGKLIGSLGVPLTAAAMGMAAIDLAKGLMQDYVTRPVGLIAAQGSAMQGITGTFLGQAQSGQFAYEGMFSEERKRAAEKARSAVDRQKNMDIFAIFGERGRAGLFDQEKYNVMNAQLYSESFATALTGEKGMSPFKKDAVEKLQGNASAYLGAQRTLGLNDPQLFGYLQSFTKNGFTDQQGLQATSGVMQAGGSTDMGRNSLVALQAQRGLDLNNSTDILGSLSHSMGSAETSKTALIEIFSNAQAIGLDKSRFAAENSKFIQSVAEAVSQGSITSRAGVAQVSDQMGNFAIGANTAKGLENAQAAYQAYKASTSETSGFSGAINTATIMQNYPALLRAAGNDPRVLQLLIKNKAMMDPESPEFKGALMSANAGLPKEQQITSEQLSDQFRKSAMGSARSQLMDKSGFVGQLAEEIKNFQGPGKFEMSDKLKQQLLGAEGQLARVPGYEGFDTPKLRQSLLGMGAEQASLNVSPEVKARIEKMKKSMQEETGKQLESPETRRSIDKIMTTSAENAGIALRTLAGTIDSLAETAAKAVAKMSGNLGTAQNAANIASDIAKRPGMHTIGENATESAANKVMQNIYAGRDPETGLTPLEKRQFHKAQDQGTHK